MPINNDNAVAQRNSAEMWRAVQDGSFAQLDKQVQKQVVEAKMNDMVSKKFFEQATAKMKNGMKRE